MKKREVYKCLQLCSQGKCIDCPLYDPSTDCVKNLIKLSAFVIRSDAERISSLKRENKALKVELESGARL